MGDNNPASPRSNTPGSLTPSRSASRAASPLRFLQQWALHRAHSRDEPFIPVDPFKWRFRFCSPRSTDEQSILPLTCCIPITPVFDDRGLFSDSIPRQLYLCLLLRLPAVYFSRVARIFEDAEVSRNDMQRIIESNRPSKLSTADHRNENNVAPSVLPFPEDWTPPAVSPALARFKNSWEEFIDSLLREWKTLNLVSALFCSFVVSPLDKFDFSTDIPLKRNRKHVSSTRNGVRPNHTNCCPRVPGVRTDEPRFRLPLHHSVRHNEEHVPCFELGGSKFYEDNECTCR